jgi:hypothetical protein
MRYAIAIVLIGCGSTQEPETRCEIRVGEQCYADQGSACEAAGCPAERCTVLRSYPGQISCDESGQEASGGNPDLEPPVCSRPDNRCVATECGTLPADWTSCAQDSDCTLAEAANVCGCTDGRPHGPFIAVNVAHESDVSGHMFGDAEEPFPCACDCTASAHCTSGTCTVTSP